MATKTSSKTATRKAGPKAFGSERKTTAPQKQAQVAPKAKGPKKGPGPPAGPAKQLKGQREKSDVSGHPAPHPETVSLIDRKRPAKKFRSEEHTSELQSRFGI